MDQAIAFNPQIVVQEAKDIVDTIEEKGTSIRLMVIIGWSEGSNMDHSWLQFKFVSYLSFTILLNHSMYDFRSQSTHIQFFFQSRYTFFRFAVRHTLKIFDHLLKKYY